MNFSLFNTNNTANILEDLKKLVAKIEIRRYEALTFVEIDNKLCNICSYVYVSNKTLQIYKFDNSLSITINFEEIEAIYNI